MKCLNCGCLSDQYICDKCKTLDILEKIFNEIRLYRPEICENPYLLEYASSLSEKYAERNIIPDILSEFDFEIAEFYYCQYYRMCRDERFEEAAKTYLRTHELTDIRSQRIIYDLIESYIPNDFIKPKNWCEFVSEADDLCCELYAISAKYFAMIGEYDVADRVALKGIKLCNDIERRRFLFYSPENMISRLEKQMQDTERYRNKKPYWPKTEERRRVIAMFYDERGIKYPRIEKKAEKILEKDFAPINECFSDELTDYCVFWCNEVFAISTVKCIYQIGAAKVREGDIIDTFESFIRPWDGRNKDKVAAAKEVGVSVEVIESADDVDIVIPKLFSFVGDDVLVSTDALGNQAKLISRAARYAGMKKIDNEFYDILDFAAETSSDFDFENNTRTFLIDYFDLIEGRTALEKAQVNKQLFDALMNYGG